MDDPRRDLKISFWTIYIVYAVAILFVAKSPVALIAAAVGMLAMLIGPFFSIFATWYHAVAVVAVLGTALPVLRTEMRSIFRVPALILLFILWASLESVLAEFIINTLGEA